MYFVHVYILKKKIKKKKFKISKSFPKKKKKEKNFQIKKVFGLRALSPWVI